MIILAGFVTLKNMTELLRKHSSVFQTTLDVFKLGKLCEWFQIHVLWYGNTTNFLQENEKIKSSLLRLP